MSDARQPEFEGDPKAAVLDDAARAALRRLQDARYVLRTGRAVKTLWRPLRDLDGKALKREAPIPEGATVTRRKGGVRFIKCPPRPAFGVGDTPFDGIIR